MQIQLTNTGKRYNRDWIFRHCTYTFYAGNAYAIIGPNGSGKSTLLQTIAGSTNASEGKVEMTVESKQLTDDQSYKYISLAAPYLEVIEEMTATEFLQFHAAFKPLLPNITIAEIIAIIGLEKNADKQIRYYSSGMKQRIKLAQAIFSDTPVLLLDEPCTNLDATGYQLYQQLISTYCSHKLIIVSSNDSQEYSFCNQQLLIGDYK
ncbi:MAG: ATP-binding cassette domain-containing protein [Deinococcales bacterium]|nr:ATP-binding cassette domain-containing protein [Chitinophagaceae bacterium]